jgi:hypothetical protein
MESTSLNVAIKYLGFSAAGFALMIWKRTSQHADLSPRYLGIVIVLLLISTTLAWRYELRKGVGFDWFTSFLVFVASVIVASAAAFVIVWGVLLATGKLS